MGDVLAKLIDLHAEHGPARVAVNATVALDPIADVWAEAIAEQRAKDAARLAAQGRAPRLAPDLPDLPDFDGGPRDAYH